jgi:GNAT superfamily N-acetyltransferase
MTLFRELGAEDLGSIAATGGHASKADPALWIEYLSDQRSDRRIVLIGHDDRSIVSYGTLLWQSAYEPFRSAGIPEINNLVVAQHARRRGIGTQMIQELERRAVYRGVKMIGIGVGLYADYGPAQKLYAKLGYQPDGHGVTYENKPVPGGQAVRLDDSLVLWLQKGM